MGPREVERGNAADIALGCSTTSNAHARCGDRKTNTVQGSFFFEKDRNLVDEVKYSHPLAALHQELDYPLFCSFHQKSLNERSRSTSLTEKGAKVFATFHFCPHV